MTDPLAELDHPAIACRRPGCGHPYPDHEDAGGHCATINVSPLGRWQSAYPCACPGFLWVDPAGPSGGYNQPPEYPGLSV